MAEPSSPLETSNDGQPADFAPQQTPPAANDGQTDDIAAIRALVLKAHPDVVPELITGTSVAELLSTIEPAQAAYGRLLESVRSSQPQAIPAPVPAVPAGGSAPVPIDPDRLLPAEKIRRGIHARSA